MPAATGASWGGVVVKGRLDWGTAAMLTAVHSGRGALANAGWLAKVRRRRKWVQGEGVIARLLLMTLFGAQDDTLPAARCYHADDAGRQRAEERTDV